MLKSTLILVNYRCPGYSAYDLGVQQGLFVKDITGGFYMGQVWPGATYYPDFLHPQAGDWWATQIKQFHDAVPFDGLWIDMNEVRLRAR